MLNISFVLPNDVHSMNPNSHQPIVVLYLMTILEEKFGDKINLSLLNYRGEKEDDIPNLLPERDIYFYSPSSSEYPAATRICSLLKIRYPNSLHIIGGIHVNSSKKEHLDGFDSIAFGEGEETIVDIVNDITNKELKSVYRNTERIDLDKYPYPLRKYLADEFVTTPGFLSGENSELRSTVVLFSRYCPYNCYFCGPLYIGAPRYRSQMLIEEEIEYLKRDYRVQALYVMDSNAIPVNRKLAYSVIDAIGRTGVKWRGQTRANGIPEEVVKLAAESGFCDISIGLESVSQKVLDICNKGINLEKTKDYISLLHKYNISVKLNLILGLPGEPPDIAKQMINYINETNPTSVILSLFTPFPGSEMAEYPSKFGMKILSDDLEKLQSVFGRFDENENAYMTYKFEKNTPFGSGKSQEEILNDYSEVQTFLRERGFNLPTSTLEESKN